MNDRFTLRTIAGLATLATAITLVALAAHRLRDETLAVLAGAAAGASATTITGLLVAVVNHRRTQRTIRIPDEIGNPTPLTRIPSLTKAERELVEDEYWRGYRDGWIHAAGTMLDLTTDQQLPPRAAYHACTRHWQTLLPYWPRAQSVKSC